MTQLSVLVQGLTPLTQRPSLDERDLLLHHVTTCNLVQELKRGDRPCDLIAPGLDGAFLAERTRDQHKPPWLGQDACVDQLSPYTTQTASRLKLEASWR